MADICLIYARPNKRRVEALHRILSQKYSVWWDKEIHAGDYRAEIERQLQLCKCVIPIWCGVSRSDADVIDEASLAQSLHKPLLPVRTEDVAPPLGFGNLHTVDLIVWEGETGHDGVAELLRNIEGALNSPPRLLPRPKNLVLSTKSFESVSYTHLTLPTICSV